jgi:hypothetical protein
MMHLSIPKPCHENWDKMTQQEQGRHCSKCDKIVVDFVNMSDDELLNYFSNTKGNVCGRMHEDQLKVHSKPKLTNKLKRFLYAVASVFLFNMPIVLFAQTSQDSNILSNENKVVLKGKVIDEKGKPMEFATVKLVQDGILKGGAKTNLKGEFIINNITSGFYDVIVTYTGYETKEINGVKIDESTEEVKCKLEKKKSNNRQMKVGMICYDQKLINKESPNQKIIKRSEIKQTGIR